MSNSKEFTMAANAVKHLHEELLKLYGLFKQSTMGDNNNDTPGFLDFKGKNTHTSEVEYITLVNELIQKYSIIEE